MLHQLSSKFISSGSDELIVVWVILFGLDLRGGGGGGFDIAISLNSNIAELFVFLSVETIVHIIDNSRRIVQFRSAVKIICLTIKLYKT